MINQLRNRILKRLRMIRLCERCYLPYTAKRVHQKWCLRCRQYAHRRKTRDYMREQRRRDPEVVMSRMRDWKVKHPDRWQEIQEKCYKRPCLRCGTLKWRRDLRKGDKFLCRECKKQERAAFREKRFRADCFYCGIRFHNPNWYTNPSKKAVCPSCYGLYTEAGKQLGLSRERIRQLAALKIQKHNVWPAEAVKMVLDEREWAKWASRGEPLL